PGGRGPDRRARALRVVGGGRARRGRVSFGAPAPGTLTMPPPLRIAVVARAAMPMHGFGGLERSVRDLVCHLGGCGQHVTLIVPPPTVRHDSHHDPYASPRIQVRHVSYLTFPLANRRGTTVLDRSTAYLLYGWRAGRLARRLALDGQVDIVHGFGASLLGAV